MGLAMQLLDFALLALAAWILWYASKAGHAFCDLRDRIHDAPRREAVFLRDSRLSLGLHRLVPVQGRGLPSADASSPPPECLGVVGQGQASVQPLFLSADWLEAIRHHDRLVRAYVYDAETDQVNLRG